MNGNSDRINSIKFVLPKDTFSQGSVYTKYKRALRTKNFGKLGVHLLATLQSRVHTYDIASNKKHS